LIGRDKSRFFCKAWEGFIEGAKEKVIGVFRQVPEYIMLLFVCEVLGFGSDLELHIILSLLFLLFDVICDPLFTEGTKNLLFLCSHCHYLPFSNAFVFNHPLWASPPPRIHATPYNHGPRSCSYATKPVLVVQI